MDEQDYLRNVRKLYDRLSKAHYECKCQSLHNPKPRMLEGHFIVPTNWHGSPDIGNIEWLCPTTHANMHVLLNTCIWLGVTPEELHPTLRLQFSDFEQDFVNRAWQFHPPWFDLKIVEYCYQPNIQPNGTRSIR